MLARDGKDFLPEKRRFNHVFALIERVQDYLNVELIHLAKTTAVKRADESISSWSHYLRKELLDTLLVTASQRGIFRFTLIKLMEQQELGTTDNNAQ